VRSAGENPFVGSVLDGEGNTEATAIEGWPEGKPNTLIS